MTTSNIKYLGNSLIDFELNEDDLHLDGSYSKHHYKIVNDRDKCGFANPITCELTPLRDVMNYECGNYFVGGAIKPKYIVSKEISDYIMDKLELTESKNGFYKIEFGEYLYFNDRTFSRLLPRWMNKRNMLDETYTLPEGSSLNTFYYNEYKYIARQNSGGTYDIFYVAPAKWYFNPSTRVLLFANTIYGNFPIFSYSGFKNVDEINYKDTDFYNNFLKNFTEEVFRHEKIFKQKETEKPVKTDEETDEIILEIKRTKSLIKDDINKNKFMKRLNKLVNTYNKGLDEYERQSKNLLSFGVKDYKSLALDLENGLSALNKDISDYNSRSELYEIMLSYLDKVLKVLKGNEIEDIKKDEFLSLLYDLCSISLKFLNDNKYDQKLKNELYDKPKNMIENHINSIASNNQNKIPFNNVSELIIYLRTVLHPILKDIANDVEKKRLVEKIQLSMLEMQRKNYKDSEDEMIQVYLHEINKLYEDCLKLIDETEKDDLIELKNVLNEPIDYNMSIEDIIKSLTMKFKKLSKIYYREKEEDYVIELVKSKRIDINML